MHPSQLYALSQIRMAEAEAEARRARVVSDCRPRRRHVLRTRVQRAVAPLRAATPAAKPAV
jgi:hypothetical protein